MILTQKKIRLFEISRSQAIFSEILLKFPELKLVIMVNDTELGAHETGVFLFKLRTSQVVLPDFDHL